MKRFTANYKLILEIDEPETDQFFGVKKSVNIYPLDIMVLLIFNVEIYRKQ